MPHDASFELKGGPTGILLLHRLCGSPAEMRYVASGLNKLGYRVHCPQLAGHDGTCDALRASTWRDWYHSAQAALDDLAQSCDTVIAAGLSTGALLALMLAHDNAEKVQATALLAPTLWLDGWSIPFYARLLPLIRSRALARWFQFVHRAPFGIKDPKVREIIHRLRAAKGDGGHCCVTPGEAAFEHRQLSKTVQALAPRITQASLIVHPRDDDYAALSNAHWLRDTLKGSVRLDVLDDCYHILTVDRQRHLVVDALAEFAAAQAAARLHAKPHGSLPTTKAAA